MNVTVCFKEGKITKNTIKFDEVLKDETLDVAKVGNIYIQKSTLKEIGWEPGKEIEVSISVKEN